MDRHGILVAVTPSGLPAALEALANTLSLNRAHTERAEIPMMVRNLISDLQWQQIEQLLPGKPSDPGQTAADNRLFVEAVLWIAVTGSPWRQLPHHMGRWDAVYLRYSRWRKNGVWDRLLYAFEDDDPDLKKPLIQLLDVRKKMAACADC